MEQHRAFPRRRQMQRLIEHQNTAWSTRVLSGLAWANAWPHLDDWFKPEAFFIGGGFLGGRRIAL